MDCTAQLARQGVEKNLLSAAEHLKRVTEEVRGDIAFLYQRTLDEDDYVGGWASSPELSPKAFEKFNSWLSSGKRSLPEAEICAIGANKLWMLVDLLCAKVSHELTQALGSSSIRGTPWWDFVSGGTLTFRLGDEYVTVHGSKNRENLRRAETYDDKNIYVTVGDGTKYRIRAVDKPDTDHIVHRGHAVTSDREDLKAEKAFMKALKHIRLCVVGDGDADVRFEPELFDDGLTATAIEELVQRINHAFGVREQVHR